MKKIKVVSLIALMFIIGTLIALAGTKTESFKVYGNCGMCETRIEKAAKSVSGVTKADWDKETKMIEVSFDESKTDIHKVHMTIAKAGHDTDLHKASDETYNKLAGCCKYERPNAKTNIKGQNGQAHSGCTRSQKSVSSSCCSSKSQ